MNAVVKCPLMDIPSLDKNPNPKVKPLALLVMINLIISVVNRNVENNLCLI